MNAIPFSQKGEPNNERNSSEGIHESLNQYHHEINITDGSEFLDDAIRIKDQPLGEVIESFPQNNISSTLKH